MKNFDLGKNARILIVKTSSLGDVINTLPLASAIKKAEPNVTIDWVVNEEYMEIVRLSPHVRKAIGFDRKSLTWWRPISTIRNFSNFKQKLVTREYDIVLDLQGLVKSAIITKVATAPVKAGFSSPREKMATKAYNLLIDVTDEATHAIEKNLAVLKALSIPPQSDFACDINIPPEVVKSAWAKLPDEPYIVVNPNSRWDSKRWPLERFSAIIKEVAKLYGLRSVIIGSSNEKERGKALAELSGSSAFDLTGELGLSALASAIQNSSGIITNDSGPMHLAAALDVPVTAIFGPTDPAAVGPFGEKHRVARTKADCSPCRKRECNIAPSCMESVTVEEVLNVFAKTLER